VYEMPSTFKNSLPTSLTPEYGDKSHAFSSLTDILLKADFFVLSLR
jgi:hypothetical protein